MSMLTGLHGTAALVLLCALLFAEESGVPLPLFPGDAILIAAGLLIANGTLAPWIFLPAACLAVLGGALAAFAWARILGVRGLWTLAERLRMTGALDCASSHLRSTGPVGMAVCRLLPGMRVYSTLVAGAAGVDIRVFLAGAIPAIVVWVTGFTLLGVLVGVPAERFLSHVQRLALQGVVLVLLGVIAYLGLRHIPPGVQRANALGRAPRLWRLLVSLVVDIGIVASVVSGIVEVARDVIGFGDPDGLIDVALVFAAITLSYVAVRRRGAGATAGEGLLDITYGPSHGT
jgi:membrane protein DedA with SNARE-associated domain